MPPGLGESLRKYVRDRKQAGKPVTREGAKKAVARQMGKVDVPIQQRRSSGLRSSRVTKNPELRRGHKSVTSKTVDVDKAIKGAVRRQTVKKAAEHTAAQKSVRKSADAAAEAIKKSDLRKSNLKKAGIGAGAALAAYGAYKLYKRHQKRDKNEDLVNELQEIMMLSDDHFDYKFESIDDVIEALLDASDDYEDTTLVSDIELYLSQLAINEAKKKKNDTPTKKAVRAFTYGQTKKGGDAEGTEAGFVGAAGLAAGTVIGTKAAKAAWKAGAKATRPGSSLRKSLHKAAKNPYVKGVTGVAAGLGAAELARRAANRRKEQRNK